MKREIKFKAKRVDNGEWVEGDLMQDYIHHPGYLTIVQGGCVYYKVHPETVCQFTGRYDNTKWEEASQKQKQYAYLLGEKNNSTPTEEWKGIEIYEGDHDSEGTFVTFCPTCSGWQFGGVDLPTREIFINCHCCDGNFMLNDITDFQVTGNIHDQTTSDNEN